MKKLILVALTLFTVSALYAQPPAGDANKGDYYGDKVSATKPMKAKALNSALAKGDTEVGQNVAVEGKVLEVCPKKGCWVKVELDDKTVASVKMKGYAFFVPVSLEGKRVKIEGKAEIATTSVEELKHFAEDAKKSQEEIDAITQPKKELKILASGIQVVK
ncbi:MAG: DUF4920 domain-containing protein [Ginsengibacter sp.]